MRDSVRHGWLAWLAAAGVAVGAGCGDGTQTQVLIELRGLAATRASDESARDHVAVWVYFRRASAPAGDVVVPPLTATPAPDNGPEVRRVLYWSAGQEPFNFSVEVPNESYTGVRVEARVWIVCQGRPAAPLVAYGTSNTAFTVPQPMPVKLILQVGARSPDCT